MSYDELLAQVYAALPQLKGQLHAPRVVYVQSQGKVYICLLYTSRPFAGAGQRPAGVQRAIGKPSGSRSKAHYANEINYAMRGRQSVGSSA